MFVTFLVVILKQQLIHFINLFLKHSTNVVGKVKNVNVKIFKEMLLLLVLKRAQNISGKVFITCIENIFS